MNLRSLFQRYLLPSLNMKLWVWFTSLWQMIYLILNKLDYRVALSNCQTPGEKQKLLIPSLCCFFQLSINCPCSYHDCPQISSWLDQVIQEAAGWHLLRRILQLNNGFVLQFQPVMVQKWKHLFLPTFSLVIPAPRAWNRLTNSHQFNTNIPE